MCLHQISFSIDGGRNDILKIKFKEHPPGTNVFFAAGPNLLEAEGMVIPDLDSTMLKVSFPNSIYLVVEYDEVEDGTFSFDFWYLDQDTNEAREDAIDGYTIEI
mmetsp:Transcript_23483/g.31470  ORF Transcript_23483/g.31470 Transcript_23483/m.31470 type:complete len:104 (-) Transcript_23483:464-775(-)|eukprot:CAMPEP_0170451952 /NCGR_PEP_ID=MMETSP0123-20130129/1022_1 /TAXON_ID=182087 /ORGANISM="Favella ehrenbergii, Strain Fehren 1" /LENGTH=103 /DNA_ID=CAMNT_0010713815 /DNA_START=54 /DNA_END=365 /DNA_ORIENTATION=-